MSHNFTEIATTRGYSLKAWCGVGHYISLPHQTRYIDAMHVIVEPYRNIRNNTGNPVFTVVVSTNSSSLSADEMDDFIEVMETAQQVALYFESILNEEGVRTVAQQ